MLSLLVILPPYAFERLTEFYYLTHQPTQFFALSGTRLYLDVAWMAISSAVVGARSRSLPQAWIAVGLAAGGFALLTFSVCEPLLCYNRGVDGLEAVRLGSILWAVGTTVSYLSGAGKATTATAWQREVASFATFYSLAFYPVIFTFSGARILPPADPFPVLILVGGLGATLTAKSGRERTATGVVGTILACAVLVSLGMGMAAQYVGQLAPFVVEVVGVTLLGVATALSGWGRGPVRWLARSKVPALALLTLTLLSTLIVFPDAEIGQVVWASNQGTPDAYSVEGVRYVGGYMSSSMVRTKAVALNVSFGPDHSRGQTSNGFLAAGLGVHAADCCTDGIDYGYRLDAVEWGNGTRGFVASSWEVCDANAACGGHSWKVLMFYRVGHYPWAAGDQIRLQVSWENRTVVWTFEDGHFTQVVGTTEPPLRVNPLFNAGALPAFLGGGAYFFQFGISEAGTIRLGGEITLTCPSLLLNGTWACADHAQTLQGDQSYWKALWRWGETFPDVQATPTFVPGCLAPESGCTPEVKFFPSNTTLPSFVRLW